MLFFILQVSVYLQNWSHVTSYVNKAEATPQQSDVGSKEVTAGAHAVATKLKCAAGLAELATKKYKTAAKYFLQASFDHCDFSEVKPPFLLLCVFFLKAETAASLFIM